jgi:hypothetical protein
MTSPNGSSVTARILPERRLRTHDRTFQFVRHRNGNWTEWGRNQDQLHDWSPQVFIVALAEDLPSLSENNVFTGTISSTQFIINNAAPAYFLESAGGTIWGVLSHDGADLYLQNSLAGNIYFLRAGVAIHGLGPGSSSIYGATSGNVALSVPAVAGANTVSIQARTGTMALRDDFIAGRLFGLTLSTAGGSATFGIAVGLASDSTAADILSLGSAYTKTTGAWAVGTGNGSLDTGAIASGNLYNVFLIKRTDTGVVDVLTSLSATAPTMPTNYTLFRRIGAMRTLAGVVWAGFTQRGDNFYLSVDIDDAVGTTVGTSRVLITSKAPPSSRALIRAYAFNATTAGVGFLIQPTFETDRAPGANMSLLGEVANQGDPGHFDIPVDSSSQFAVRSQNAAGSFYCRTYGWVDDRGKLS